MVPVTNGYPRTYGIKVPPETLWNDLAVFIGFFQEKTFKYSRHGWGTQVGKSNSPMGSVMGHDFLVGG